MKKKLLGILSFLSITAVASFNLNLNTNNGSDASVVFDNIEALADETVRGMVECHGDGQLFCYVTNTCDYKEILIYQ
ncbi:MAG: hypothetical protein GX639_18740 [Fibrobacter sp.]|nr:hypothetical protein [Fibrobacter sp.]